MANVHALTASPARGRRWTIKNRGRALRLHIKVDLLGRNSHERVLEAEVGFLLPTLFPDVVETVTGDAAGKMGVELG